MTESANTNGTQAVDRALSILEFVARGTNRATVDEVASATKLHRNTAYRLVRALVARDYLDLNDGRCSLGPMAIVLGQSGSRDEILLRKSQSHLQELSETIGEVVNLGILRKWEVFYLGRWERTEPSSGVYVRTGQRAPLYASALGKIMLASMPPRDREQYYSRCEFTAYTPQTITDSASLQKAVEQSRISGFGEDVEELSDGVRCVARPISANGEVIAAASVSIPSVRFSPTTRNAILKELADAVDRISRDLSLPKIVF